MEIVFLGCQNLFSGKIKKNILFIYLFINFIQHAKC